MFESHSPSMGSLLPQKLFLSRLTQQSRLFEACTAPSCFALSQVTSEKCSGCNDACMFVRCTVIADIGIDSENISKSKTFTLCIKRNGF